MNKELLYKELNELLSYKKIGDKYGYSTQEISYMCTKFGFKKISEIKKDMESKIIEDFINGISIKEICKKYKIGDKKLTKLTANVERIDPVYENLISDKDFLHYFIGMIASDGYIYEKKNRVELNLNLDDIDLVKNMSEKLGVSMYIDEDRKSPRARILFASKKIVELLNSIGIKQKKSGNMVVDFDKMDKEYIHSFIRGYFDGDGTIFNRKKNSENKTAAIVGNYDTIDKIHNILLFEDIHCTINDLSNNNVSFPFYRVSIHTQSEIQKLYDYMYNNSTIHLERKHIKF